MNQELAGRGARLLAIIIDGLLGGVPTIGVAVFVPLALKSQPDEAKTLIPILMAVWVLYIVALMIIQVLLLHRKGQTLGKMVARVRIVLVNTGENGGFMPNVILRTVGPYAVCAIPYIGQLFCLVDVLFIFRADRRCIHDLIAKTHVVRAA